MSEESSEFLDVSETRTGTNAGGPRGTDMPLQRGAKLGDFKILKVLGEGGMGIVYKAYERPLERIVALKVLLPAIRRDASHLKQFRKEAVLAANLSHDNIVRIHRIDAEASVAYFTMDFVPGVSVKDKVEDEGFLSPAHAARIALQACRALHYAHGRNIIHRDVKPSNLLLDSRTGDVRITDFGIAQDLTGQLGDRTPTDASSAGTPIYMSPEQHAGEKLDPRTDVFSLGMTLYYMLTAKSAFHAQTRREIVAAFKARPPDPPSRFNQAVSPALDQIVLKMLAVDRDQRYASCEEAAQDLEQYLAITGSTLPTRKAARRLAGIVAGVVCLAGALLFGPWLVRSWFARPPAGPDPALAATGRADDDFRAGRIDQAQQAYRSVVDSEGAGPAARAVAAAGLGRIASARGDKQAAEQWYRRALGHDARNVRARAGLAALLADRGRAEEALGVLQAGRDDPWLQRTAGRVQRALETRRRLETGEHVRRLVDDLVRQYNRMPKRPDGTPEDTWTSRPVAVCFHAPDSRGRPAFHEGADEMLVHELTEGMLKAARFGVVERRELGLILRELRVSASRLARPDAALRLGRLESARGQVFVSVDRRQDATAVSLRLTDAETSRICGLASAEAVGPIGPDQTRRLVDELTAALEKFFPLRGRITGRTDATVALNIGSRAGLRVKTPLAVYADGDPPKEIAELEVVGVSEDQATARVVRGPDRIKERLRVQAKR